MLRARRFDDGLVFFDRQSWHTEFFRPELVDLIDHFRARLPREDRELDEHALQALLNDRPESTDPGNEDPLSLEDAAFVRKLVLVARALNAGE